MADEKNAPKMGQMALSLVVIFVVVAGVYAVLLWGSPQHRMSANALYTDAVYTNGVLVFCFDPSGRLIINPPLGEEENPVWTQPGKHRVINPKNFARVVARVKVTKDKVIFLRDDLVAAPDG